MIDHIKTSAKINTRTVKGTAFLLAILFDSVGLSYAAQDPIFVGSDFTGKPCHGKTRVSNNFGPYDYTTRSQNLPKLSIVENYHFTPEVESLIKGATTNLPYGDIAYTLTAWPNHHRALHAMYRYSVRLKRQGKTIPIAAECWFQRAIRFNSNDATSHMLYGAYLQKSKKTKSAESQYQKALGLNPNDIQTHYNYGLLLVELKRYEEAKKHALTVYAKSFPLPGLRKKLKNAGYWP